MSYVNICVSEKQAKSESNVKNSSFGNQQESERKTPPAFHSDTTQLYSVQTLTVDEFSLCDV